MKTVNAVNKTMVYLDTIKIYSLNALAFLSTLTTLDTVLKLTLLVVSIVYTTVKIFAVIKNELKIKGTVEKMENNVKELKGIKEEIKNEIKNNDEK